MGALLLAVLLLLAGCGGSGGAPDAAVDARAIDAAPLPDAAPDAALGLACAAQGGTCVPGKWAQCPVGQEPTADVHADCKPAGSQRGYFCCVPAPPSPCSDNVGTDCFSGSCHACWGSGPTLACESGRVCCNYQCTD